MAIQRLIALARNPLARIPLACIVLSLTGQAWARGPLLLPENTPPNNLATLDADALRGKATRGDAAAAADLGALYAHGWKLRRDPAEAMRWLTRAVTLKNKQGRRELGLLLLRGDGVARDPERAVALLQEAAEAGDAMAAAGLGVAYADGDGTPRS